MQIQAMKYNNQYSRQDTIKYLCKFVGKSILSAFLFVIILVFLLFSIIVGDTIYNFSKGNNVVPLFAGYIIISPSMVPTIKVNDAVIVKRADSNELKIGDIITFSSLDKRYEGLIITHRIVGTQKLSTGDIAYRTKGDNNRVEDSAVVTKNTIYGRVVFKIPKLGYIKDFINTPIGFIIFIILPVLLILSLNIKTIFFRKKYE